MGRLVGEPEPPGQPGKGVLEGLAPEIEVVAAGPNQDAGGDTGPQGSRLEAVGRLERLGVLIADFEPTGQTGEMAAVEELGRIVGGEVALEPWNRMSMVWACESSWYWGEANPKRRRRSGTRWGGAGPT